METHQNKATEGQIEEVYRSSKIEIQKKIHRDKRVTYRLSIKYHGSSIYVVIGPEEAADISDALYKSGDDETDAN